jgi:hypothetical protein
MCDPFLGDASGHDCVDCLRRESHQRAAPSNRSFARLISAFTERVSSRISSQYPPVKAFLDAVALPSGVRGPVC